MRYSLVLLFLSTFFISCEMQNESEKRLIEDAIYSLERSNESLEELVMAQAVAFNSKKMDVQLKEKINKWGNIFDSILFYSNTVTKYINEQRNIYFRNNENLKFSFNKDALIKFKKAGEDTVLYKMVNNYQYHMLNLNEDLNEEFKGEVHNIFKDFLEKKNIHNYCKLNLSSLLDNQLYLKLAELINRIKVLENKFLISCNERCRILHCMNYEKYTAIVGQNSSVLRKGDKVLISAGVGEFSTSAMPNIFMANKKIEVNPDGIAIYEFAAPSKKGKYLVPVNIAYTKPDGTKEKREYKIEYEVVE